MKIGPWEEYRASLDLHLRASGEAALAEGYELGRAALARGMSLLELVETHSQALGAMPEPPKHLALEFLEEALSPFEMALRGYREANQHLAQANEELAEANRKLKETQAQLVHSAKMASLGTLTAGMAHEINNPLAFCLSNVHSIQLWICKLRSDPELAHLWQKTELRLDQLNQGLERIKELVVSLRKFSRLDESEIKTVNIHESLESALLFLSHETAGRITIVRDFQCDGELTCYPGLLGQVAMNLLSNAVQAIEAVGTITVSTRREPGWLSIAIEDSGSGIPPEHHDRIFDPFFTTRPVGAGTGLGLAITYQLVQAHYGTLSLESEVGRGSCFKVALPTDLDERRRA